MKRVDFLISLLWSSAMLFAHLILNEEWVIYLALVLIPAYALQGWMLQIQINMLRRDGNFAGDEFNKKYKHLWELL